jgi:CIC family chloride channel protein
MKLPDLAKSLEIKYLKKWSIIGVLVGIIAGIGAVVFFEGLKLGTRYFLGYGAGFFPPEAGESLVDTLDWTSPRNLWLIPIVITLGGLISGFLVYTFAPEAEGHGTDAAIRAFHRENGVIRKRIPLIKMAASIITISTGGSAGREGPIAQIGAGFGSIVGSILKLSPHDRRLAVTVGIGAGIGSIFKAPLGGALLSTEILYMRDFEKEALIPSVIASIMGFSIFCFFEGYDPVFRAIPYSWNIYQLPFFLVLGLVCAIVGILYISAFYKTWDIFRNIFEIFKIPIHFKPSAGAAMVGLLAVFLAVLIPEGGGAAGLGGLTMGYGFIQLAMYNQLPIKVMFTLIFAKIAMTSLTIGSGGSGGVFAPGLVIGAMVGGTLGALFNLAFPSVVPPAAIPAFVIIGMMALFGGVAKVPIAVIIMVSEMTNDFTLLLPSMVAIVGSYILTGDKTIYREQVATRLNSPAHTDEYLLDLLKTPVVKDAMRTEFPRVEPKTTVKEAVLLMKRDINALPIVENDRFIGCVSLRDIIKTPFEKWAETPVKKIITPEPCIIYPDDSLLDAIRRMESIEKEILFVVNKMDTKKLEGILLKTDIIKIREPGRVTE